MDDSTRAPESSLGTLAMAIRQDEVGTAPKPPEAAAPEGKAARIAAFVEAWWAAHFPGSVVGRTTDAWNVAHAAKEDLKSRLEEI